MINILRKTVFLIAISLICINIAAQTNFIVANDLGRNGYYHQKPIAELMGRVAEEKGIEFVAAVGDVHHFEGVESTSDPLWMTNYELVYSHPELMLPWYPVCGNHEYRGNTQAVVDYSKVSRRWQMPSRYYSKTIEAGDTTALLLFIDTTPLMDKYRQDKDGYPDACLQDREKQIKWIENTLRQSTAKWKIVLGHHPLYADTYKKPIECEQMRDALKAIFDKYNVDFYFSGHVHSFQHIKPKDCTTDYIVTSSASLAREVKPTDDTKFCSNNAGFSFVTLNSDTATISFVNYLGKTIYSYSRTKK